MATIRSEPAKPPAIWGMSVQVELIGRGEKTPRARYPKVLKAVGKAPPQYPPEDETEE